MTLDTFGDRRQDLSIPEMGGKGVFSKEIQELVLTGDADLAVHSAKDLQAVTPDGLTLAGIPRRGDPRDALVGHSIDALPEGAIVATGSNRRSALLRARRPDLRVVGLRGNIATRLAKLGSEVDGASIEAVVLAATALDRLGLTPEPVERLDPEIFVPQVGQGALAVEAREGDDAIVELVAAIDDHETALAVTAERSFLAELGGDCTLPAGAHARVVDDGDSGPRIEVRGVLAAEDGSALQRAVEVGPVADDPGRELARTLRKMLEAAAPSHE